jgi:hypothetical protein
VLAETSEAEWPEIADWIRHNPNIMAHARGNDSQKPFDTNGELTEECKKKILEQVQNSGSFFELYRDTGIACFADRCNNILMWSHYTNGHQGFCLEFDTNYLPFRHVKQGEECVYQVEYSESYPTIPVAVVLNLRKLDDKYVKQPFITKAECWRYEQEWRVLIETGGQSIGYEPNALTGVYLGCKISEENRNEIARALNGYTGPIYQMKRSETTFTLESQLVSPRIS